MKTPTPTTKSLLRLLRRADAHGVRPWHIIRTEQQIIVLFHHRHIRVRDDGSLVPDMHPRYTPDREELRVDPQWRNSFNERMHAEHMNWAAHCRKFRWMPSARINIKMATELRMGINHD